uniref:Amidase n=1 Tax=Virgibacillus oceani TaxID=1479511 RepID=A0A917M6A1_9BACI|nr:amidase [Virgibacillus oceani]
MANEELATKSIEELSPLIRERKISPVELTDSVLNQVEKYNKSLNAYLSIYDGEARQAAKKAEEEIIRGNYRGSLHGIPMGIKDNIYFKNKITTMGSKIHQNFMSTYDATVIKRLRDAGVIFTGKLNMHEYALGVTTENPHYGPSRNPWNPNKISGGSSGGPGVAIAANMSIASLGTDTSGSINIPSSFCGIVGLKPTYGKVSKYGCFPEAWSLDHVGPMSKTVADAATILSEIEGFDENDPSSIKTSAVNYRDHLTTDIAGMVIGINEDYFFKDVDNDVEQAVRSAIKVLKSMGARIETVEVPVLEFAEYALMVTDFSELGTVHHYNINSRPLDYGDDVRLLIESGQMFSAVDYLQAQQIRRKLKSDFKKAFEKVDVLLAPSTPAHTPDIGNKFVQINGNDVHLLDNLTRFTGPVNLAGLPSLILPCGLIEGIPVGMQLIGPAFKEEKILKVGYAFEASNPLKGKKPNLEVLI